MRLLWLMALIGACGRDHFDPPHNIAFVTSTVHDPLTFGGDLSGPTWVRLDGVELAATPLDFVAGVLETSPSMTAAGSQRAALVLAGQTGPGDVSSMT